MSSGTHNCAKDEIISNLLKEQEDLNAKLLDAIKINLNTQARLVELTDGKKIDLDFHDEMPLLPKLSIEEDADHFIYQNLLKIPKSKKVELDNVKTDKESDHKFAKILLQISFHDKFMLDMCQNGSSKAEILAAIINSSEYFIMNDIFKLRVYTNGEGNQERFKTFESVAKKKIDNWWRLNSVKYAAGTSNQNN